MRLALSSDIRFDLFVFRFALDVLLQVQLRFSSNESIYEAKWHFDFDFDIDK